MIVAVGTLLGLAIAGLPSRQEDAPLAVQTATSVAVSTTAAVNQTAPPPPPAPAAPSARPPGQVRVTAFNSSSLPGTAGRLSTKLKSLGYNVLPPSADRSPQPASVVMHRPGFDGEARALASALGLDAGTVRAIEPAVTSLAPETDLAVLVGEELAKRTP